MLLRLRSPIHTNRHPDAHSSTHARELTEGGTWAGWVVVQPLTTNRFRINKSRYDSIDCYISEDAALLPEYNDLDLVYDHAIYDRLRAEGRAHTQRERERRTEPPFGGVPVPRRC
jgi:hypothetical protein